MRQHSKPKLWFVRPAGSYLLLLTAICAACLTPNAPPRQESHTVKAKILLSKLSIEPSSEATSDLRNLLQDLLALEPADLQVHFPAAVSVVLTTSEPVTVPEVSFPHALFERPPPASLL